MTSTDETKVYTIGIVDDNPMILECYDLSIKSKYLTKTAQEGFEALQSMQDVDAVILDYNMPGMNGIETYQKLKEINPGVKGMITTGNLLQYQRIKNQAEKEGIYTVLEKPVSPQELNKELENLLES